MSDEPDVCPNCGEPYVNRRPIDSVGIEQVWYTHDEEVADGDPADIRVLDHCTVTPDRP